MPPVDSNSQGLTSCILVSVDYSSSGRTWLKVCTLYILYDLDVHKVAGWKTNLLYRMWVNKQCGCNDRACHHMYSITTVTLSLGASAIKVVLWMSSGCCFLSVFNMEIKINDIFLRWVTHGKKNRLWSWTKAMVLVGRMITYAAHVKHIAQGNELKIQTLIIISAPTNAC